MKQLRRITGIVLAVAVSIAPAVAGAVDWKDRLDLLLAPGYKLVPGDHAADVPDTLVFVANKRLHLLDDIPTLNENGSVNYVVEIPTGDNRKFEIDADTGRLFWELKGGKPRIVKYLGYPTNYGSIPRTLGGDGDPIDMLAIGEMELRGSISSATLVGVMRMNDGGDVDDKLIGVLPGTSFEGKSLADLDAAGVLTILKAWFENYKGPGEIQVTGFDGVAEAQQVLEESMAAYQAAH